MNILRKNQTLSVFSKEKNILIRIGAPRPCTEEIEKKIEDAVNEVKNENLLFSKKIEGYFVLK